MKTTLYGCEWVVACIAPWAVSKHPNFSTGPLTPYGALALVTEGRAAGEDELTALRELGPLEPWALELIDSARESTDIETLEGSVGRLWRIAHDIEVSPGGRVAASLYASVAENEMDRPDVAVRQLRQVVDDLSSITPDGHLRVIRAALAQQLVMRLRDSSQHTAALEVARQMSGELGVRLPIGQGSFSVSSGLGWSARRVISDVTERLRNLNASALFVLDSIESQAWVGLVRSRPDWVRYRTVAASAEASNRLVNELYRRRFESTRDVVRMGVQPAWVSEYYSYLVHELSGDVGSAARARSSLAKTHLLEANELSEFAASEVLRLLRHAGDHGTLRVVAQWVRDNGPVAVLSDAVRAILQRVSRSAAAVEGDLVVLSVAADFLDKQDSELAVGACEVYLKTERKGGRFNWSATDLAWSTIARLVRESGMDDVVAERLLEAHLASTSKEVLQSTFMRVMEAISWESVRSTVKDRWRDELQAAAASNKESEELLTFFDELTGNPVEKAHEVGIDSAAKFADGDLALSDEAIVELSEFLVGRITQERQEATRGYWSVGGPDVSNVAVAFALRQQSPQLWLALREHLSDPKVNGGLKRDALERIARNADELPLELRIEFGAVARALIGALQTDLFATSSGLPVFPEAFRAAAAMGAVSEGDALSIVMKLAAEGDRGRLEAAKSISAVATGVPGASWASPLLLSYTYDRNPTVRAEAAFGLPFLIPTESQSGLVAGRYRELLRSDGLRVVARALIGLQVASSSRRPWLNQYVHDLQELSRSSRPRVVRELAEEALSRLREINPDR